ncbi:MULTISPECIES: glycosyltransferase N-terminal domain-containing protein [Maritimibacter]|jgi:3-deoxy-D-manno-octulosonic-acid transferase|uniref:3-deoxy-D-manno-octulosonic acid transferase n=1 Tax=Maritimibacter TaxID=404235 RepID=UPI0011083513|nr:MULTISPECIES: glycosyltransferase N-terminal domain-containing protein [Maritimibacter]MBL6427591.1 3-deoxy-D-manno-octulosonic acid transferase [Maritimibacter sp.]
MAKRPGLSFYLASQKLRGRARAEARLKRGLVEGSEDRTRAAERLGKPRQDRPAGPLIWLHAGNEVEALGFPELVDRLADEREDLSFLVTTTGHDPDHPLEARLPSRAILQYAPYGEDGAVEAFLGHWRPDICLWAENRFEPGLIDRTASAGVDMVLVDARVPERAGWRWLPGIRRTLLRQFTHVFAGDDTARTGLIGLGVSPDRIETVGFLQEGTAPLTCSQAERDMLAEELAARPVWLAAGAGADEFAILTGVHQQVMRRSHRLLLILAPQDPNEGPLLARKLESEGWVVGLRSLEDEPEPEVEIYIADVPGELGLWYRLAPTSFLGGTLSGGPVRNPYEAAALGSAVLYGPRPGPWRESFERLRDAGAARCVSDKQDLTRAVEELLAPDHVARMASAAWDVTTNGAQATDRVVELVLDTLDRKGV